MSNFDTFSLECFLAASQTKSFTKAAKKVSRTQSAVTQQISKLEKALGKPLFQRGKEMVLTKDGEILESYAEKILHLHQEMLDRFRHPELEGEVRFGVPEDFASKFLSDVLVEFSKIHPRISLYVECDLTLNLLHRFQQGEFDMVLVKMSRPEHFPHGVDVWSESLEWVGVDQRFNGFDKKPFLPLVLAPQPCVFRKIAIQALEAAKIQWKTVYISPSYAGSIAAVKAGMGITILPRTMIPENLIVFRDPALPHLPDIHVSLLKQEKEQKALKTLEDFLLEKLH